MLTLQEQERYARQIMMPELGEAGQETLKRSRVLVIGAGGLGSPAAYYLAAAGVGTIGIADGDTVELSNLQRQILHKESRLGQNKAVSAAKSLHGLNAQVHVQTYSQFMDEAHLRQVLPEVLDRLGEMSESENHLPGLSTGMSAVDQKITGLNKSDLILLAARPGMGKTSFALNVALNVAKAVHKTVAVFSLEMSREQLATRLLASEALVENNRLKTGALRETDWEKIAGAATILNKVDIRIDDNPMLSVADMNAKCRRLDDLGLVVIDYLQLMTSAGGKGYAGENRQQVVSDISRMLKIMAKELNVPVIALSQLSRATEMRGGSKRPQLSDLRESGAIEQDADIVMFIYRDDYYDDESENKNIAEIIIAKNRHGATGTIELQWVGQYTTFSNPDRIHEE